jgi:hypothetical protein
MEEADKVKLQIEVYSLEYKTASDRYENIYKALWQNFSYLAVVSGAILTFGKDATGANPFLLGIGTCIPLLFWYWGCFRPLNRYGDNTSSRLAQIEKAINPLAQTGLGHYQLFDERRTSGRIRARPWLWAYGLVLLAIVLSTGIIAFRCSEHPHAWYIGFQALAPKVSAVCVAFVSMLGLTGYHCLRFKNDVSVREVVHASAALVHLAVVAIISAWLIDTIVMIKINPPPKPTQTIVIQAAPILSKNGKPLKDEQLQIRAQVQP